MRVVRLRVDEDRQPELDRPQALLAGHDQRPEQAVPAPEEIEEDDRRQGRPRQRRRHVPERPQVAAAVERGGVIEILRDGSEELAQQEDAEDVGREGDDQPQVGVVPAEPVDDDVVGDQRYLEGDHHRRQEEGEDDVLTPEFEPREGVGRQHGGEQHTTDHAQADDRGIEEVLPEGRGTPRLGVVAGVERGGEDGRGVAEGLGARLHRGQ